MATSKRLRQWLADLVTKRDAFGLTRKQRDEILGFAKGKGGRALAERIACRTHGLTTSEFDLLLEQHGIQ